MTNIYLLIDYMNPEGTLAITKRLDKINYNIGLLEPMKKYIDEQRKTVKEAFTSMTIFGRWIVLYKANITNDESAKMYFFDFRRDLTDLGSLKVFSQRTLNAIKTLQDRYIVVFPSNLDTVELTFAEPFEKVTKPNFFICDIDNVVIEKAKLLGVFPAIENLKNDEKVKVAIADEKVKIDKGKITNIYAIFHFEEHGEERQNENGYMYLKIYDLLNNIDRLNDFQNVIEKSGGKFDRSYFMERFHIAKSN
jgi:hypothetical protein